MQPAGAHGGEAGRPGADDRRDRRIRHVADQGAASGPATSSSAVSILPTWRCARRVDAAVEAERAVSIAMACRNQSTARRGEQIQRANSSAPATRSQAEQRLPQDAETKVEAALFGRPGRMTRSAAGWLTASSMPRREASCSSSSAVAFSAP